MDTNTTTAASGAASHPFAWASDGGSITFDEHTAKQRGYRPLVFADDLPSAPAAQEAEPAGYRISDPEEPEIGSWFSETPARAKYGLLSEPLYAHPPRPQADAGAAFGRLPADVTPADAVRHAKRFGAREVPAYGNKDNPLLLYPADLARMLAAAPQATAAEAADSVLAARAAQEAEPAASAHRVLRRDHSGEWVHDGRHWVDGPAPVELVRDCEKEPERWRVENAYTRPPRPQADAGAQTAVKVTQDMRRVFREAYRVGGFWADRLDYALDRMLAAAPAAAPQAPAAGAAPSLDDLTELVRSLGHSTRRQSVEIASAVLARWGAAAPAQDAPRLIMHAAGETELARIWTKVDAIRAKQAAKPKHSPLPEHAPSPAPAQEAEDGWMPIETAPEGERVLLGPRHAPVVGTVHRPEHWHEEEEPTVSVVHYNGNVLVAGYRCSEWHRLPGAARARQEGGAV